MQYDHIAAFRSMSTYTMESLQMLGIFGFTLGLSISRPVSEGGRVHNESAL